jgi:Ca-activated chloride channel homolog
MNFLSPLNLLWALPIGGLIVVMYILKLRRKDVVVSSTYLWRQVIRDVQANAPFQKLRKNLLLLLQLIIAALVILALARPLWRTFGIGGRNIVLIVDTSASMRATDVAPTRLDAAKQVAYDLINGMKPGDLTMVLSASSRPEAATGFTADRTELRRAVDGLKPHDTPTNMRDALNLAADLVASRNNGDNGRIELVSDGGFEAQESANGGTPEYTLTNLNLGKTHVAFHPIGKGHDNVGIIAVDFRRNLGSEKTVQLLVVTHNYSAQAKKFNEEIYARDDQGQENLVEAHEVSLASGAESTEPYDILEPDSPRPMRVHLDLTDDLPADNDAALILKPRKTLKVLLVGPENLFLQNALQVDPGVQLGKSATYPGDKEAKPFDVVVFYTAAPAKLPEGNYLFLHCTSDQCPVKVNGSEENVAPADWDKEHPALRYVDFGSNRFQEALKASPLGWGREIAVAESGSLIVAGEKDKMRALFVGFDLDKSRFPLTVAFPIFMSNSVRWLGTGGDDSERGQVHTGDTITIPAPPEAGTLTVTRPDGSKRSVTVGERDGATFVETDLIGLYTAAGKNFNYPFAANLNSATESDTTPHRSLTILANPTPATGHRVADNRDLIPFFALLALIILCVEWWVFHRRVHLN